ncbi:5'-3' exonuclease PLD3-like isoform X2 [Ornithodoros turicata]|uniref:5'-3' exonuclease PLD3-like isoform X2 n=1 Tax=Ornithodoros turicata TaxID=34597 RepID=UPI003139ECAF
MGIRISSIYRETVLDSAGKLDFGEFELQLFDNRYMVKDEPVVKRGGWLRPSCIPITIILILIILVVLFPLLDHSRENARNAASANRTHLFGNNCTDSCLFTLVESIPENLTFPTGAPHHMSIFDAWNILLDSATSQVHIASFYWTLRGKDIDVDDPSDWQGEEIFSKLMYMGRNQSIDILIAQNAPSKFMPSKDTEDFAKAGAAKVRSVDFNALLGAGVLHTKFWIVDRRHFFVGSANMDWRSLTQVKEIGALVMNCSCLAQDLEKVFDVYWSLGLPNATIPQHWPASLSTVFNKEAPAYPEFNGTATATYFSSSPAPLSPEGRTNDIDSILDTIHKANEYIYISVMDYYPITLYTSRTLFWPVIDDALRAAAIERGIHVRLLVSKWNHTRPEMERYLSSLAVIRSKEVHIEVKLFIVPAFTPAQQKIPASRVNHDKYMVTDNAAFIGTSNWAGDYFINTAGVSMVMQQPQNDSSSVQPIRQQLCDVFERDWHSPYAHPLLSHNEL